MYLFILKNYKIILFSVFLLLIYFFISNYYTTKSNLKKEINKNLILKEDNDKLNKEINLLANGCNDALYAQELQITKKEEIEKIKKENFKEIKNIFNYIKEDIKK